MKQIDLREAARRQHRAVALFAIIQCWIRGLDGLYFSREHLTRLLGIETFQKSRRDWLERDLGEAFLSRWFHDNKTKNKFGGFFVARVRLRRAHFAGATSIQEVIELTAAHGVTIGVFHLWPEVHTWESERLDAGFEAFAPMLDGAANFDERMLNSYLGLLFQGVLSPRQLVEPFKAKGE